MKNKKVKTFFNGVHAMNNIKKYQQQKYIQLLVILVQINALYGKPQLYRSRVK